MTRIKIKANSSNQQVILDYLEKNASDSLCERINAGSKTITQCWNYILTEARKLAKGNCACVEDATVFGWAVHFFEEDDIKADEYNDSPKAEVSKSTTPVAQSPQKQTPKRQTKKENDDSGQISLADLFGEMV